MWLVALYLYIKYLALCCSLDCPIIAAPQTHTNCRRSTFTEAINLFIYVLFLILPCCLPYRTHPSTCNTGLL